MDSYSVGLSRLVDLIDQKLAEIGKPSASWTEVDWREHRACIRDIQRDLIEQEGARFAVSNGAQTMRLGGISSSCTSSLEGLFRNWQGAARRKIAAISGPIPAQPQEA